MAIALEEITMAFRALSDDDSAAEDRDDLVGAGMPEEEEVGQGNPEGADESIEDLEDKEEDEADDLGDGTGEM